MPNRTGTYVAFHAAGTTDPTASDIKYYNMLKAWHANDNIEFRLTNSHEKTAAVRDSSSRLTLINRLKERLRASKNMLLIITDITRQDTDCVPFEIGYAIDTCQIPIIACYPDYSSVCNPAALRPLWPEAFSQRIDNWSARVIHIGFSRLPVLAAITTYSPTNQPEGSQVYYLPETYRRWGLL
jgi:hypothetical protein